VKSRSDQQEDSKRRPHAAQSITEQPLA
jgi:hypothetical protein